MAHSSKVTKTIVKTVADYENASSDQLPALADKIDAETLNQLVSPESELSEPLTFEYLWYDVIVLPNGAVIVIP